VAVLVVYFIAPCCDLVLDYCLDLRANSWIDPFATASELISEIAEPACTPVTVCAASTGWFATVRQRRIYLRALAGEFPNIP